MTEIRRNRVRTRIDDSSMPGRALHRPPAAPGALPAPPAIVVAPAEPAPESDRALHVLAMAERTAEEHLRAVHQAAEELKAEARAAAERISQEAETRRQQIREQADQLLEDTRKTVEQQLGEARGRAEELEREAREVLAKARAEAERTDAAARADAEKLRRSAQFRHDHVVGGLEATRESYQQQIEALAKFDHEYRARLATFMQSQLRSLWTDQPHVDDEPLAGPPQKRPTLRQVA